MNRIQPKLTKAWRHGSLIVPSRQRCFYLGWVGHENMGDEAMYLVHKQLFPGVRFVDDRRISTQWLAMAQNLTLGRSVRALILGGGTFIGRHTMRTRISRALEALPQVPAHVLGVGVLDPEFPGEVHGATLDELKRWRATLAPFDVIRVRGPRSHEILEHIGIESQVVGDPALLLGDAVPTTNVRERLLGLNAGMSREFWGNDPEALIGFFSKIGQIMIRRGWRVRLIPVWSKDLPILKQLAKELGDAAELLEDFSDLDRLFSAIRECNVFIGQKLHSVVFASSLFVPALMIEYAPKCRDFQLSIGRGRFTMRTDRLNVDEAIDILDELSSQRTSHADALVVSVNAVRRRLETHAGHLCEKLSLAGVPNGHFDRRSGLAIQEVPR